MNLLTAPHRSFGFAVAVSVAIHLVGALMLLGTGQLWLTAPPETKVEWVWTAPAAPLKPAAAPSAPTAPAVSTAPASPAVAPPAATAPPETPPPATATAASTPTAPTAPAAPPVATSPAAPAVVPTSDSLPSGTGYAIVPPRLRERPPAVLPPQLAPAGVSGEVLLQVEVLEDGRVGRISVSRSSGVKALDEFARQYVAGWRFEPAWQPQGQKPVRVMTALSIRYGMQKE